MKGSLKHEAWARAGGYVPRSIDIPPKSERTRVSPSTPTAFASDTGRRQNAAGPPDAVSRPSVTPSGRIRRSLASLNHHEDSHEEGSQVIKSIATARIPQTTPPTTSLIGAVLLLCATSGAKKRREVEHWLYREFGRAPPTTDRRRDEASGRGTLGSRSNRQGGRKALTLACRSL